MLNPVDDRLFGGFFEKATWNGEIGSDAAISMNTGKVIPEVREYMDWMNIPILRFPGGTAIDYYPWYNLIDSMPGKHSQRPRNLHYKDLNRKDVVNSDGRTGLHEFVALCKELDIAPLFVTNLGDAFYKKIPIEQAAQELGADLVNYCNASDGKWAELRAANGSAEPFNIRYFQIGNETWLFDQFRKNERSTELKDHYAACVLAYAKAMKAADPSIQLIIDGVGEINEEILKSNRDLVSYTTFHSYSPWGISQIKMGDSTVLADSVSAKAVWQGLAAAPKIDEESGLSIIEDWVLDHVEPPLAMTEWNLNCWFQGEAKAARPYNEFLAYGIGAGSYLNAILRVSDKVRIANQSMLVGTGWGITSIRVDTTEQKTATMYPTGMVTGLYSRNHGNQLMKMEVANARFYQQPLTLSGISPSAKVAEQDVVVTADEAAYYVHVVNRSFDEDVALAVVFPERVRGDYTHFLLSDRSKGAMSAYANIETIQLTGASDKTTILVPSKSVSVFVFNK
ncbi:MAG: hypothetical protein HC819_04595 [Cyclobacteriaceae bacterium]|nr:hypothetical protein [Cyclobacteriaceae bacterium]